jgi:hypothetical protein
MSGDPQQPSPDPNTATGIFTATPRSQAYIQSLQQLLGLVNLQTVPTGILHTTASTLFSIERYNGTTTFDTITQWRWEQHYHDLQRSIIKESSLVQQLVPLVDLKRQAQHHSSQGITPIAILDLLHNYPNRRLVHAVVKAAKNDQAIQLSQDPRTMLDERRVFMASALLPDRFENFTLLPSEHEGLAVKFILDPQFYFTNNTENLRQIEIDFADGSGFRPVNTGQVVEVNYTDEGAKQVRIRAYVGDEQLSAGFFFKPGK